MAGRDAPGQPPDYRELTFPPPPAERPWVVVNMITSLDGRVRVADTERGLGSDTDRRLMRELRAHADVVLGGVGTMRTSGNSSRVPEDLSARRVASGRSPHPIASVLTGSGELPTGAALFTAPDLRAVVYVGGDAPAERVAALRATGREVVELSAAAAPAEMLRHMRRELGAELVLVEGGPHLNGELWRRGLVDEFFLTLAPVIVGGPADIGAVVSAERSTVESLRRAHLLSAYPDGETGELFLRYRLPSIGGD